MTEQDIRHVVDTALGNVAPEADLSSLDDSADIRMELDIDSIGFLEFITALHAALGVDIPDTDAAKLNTRAAVLTYLTSRLCTAHD